MKLEFMFQLLLKGCTIEAYIPIADSLRVALFQLLLKGCTIEAAPVSSWRSMTNVSVVVERMYD